MNRLYRLTMQVTQLKKANMIVPSKHHLPEPQSIRIHQRNHSLLCQNHKITPIPPSPIQPLFRRGPFFPHSSRTHNPPPHHQFHKPSTRPPTHHPPSLHRTSVASQPNPTIRSYTSGEIFTPSRDSRTTARALQRRTQNTRRFRSDPAARISIPSLFLGVGTTSHAQKRPGPDVRAKKRRGGRRKGVRPILALRRRENKQEDAALVVGDAERLMPAHNGRDGSVIEAAAGAMETLAFRADRMPWQRSRV